MKFQDTSIPPSSVMRPSKSVTNGQAKEKQYMSPQHYWGGEGGGEGGINTKYMHTKRLFLTHTKDSNLSP